jgi:DHA1 family tetracycline resistance protein-like MFS transporter
MPDASDRGRRRAAFVFILVTIGLDSLSFGLIAPVLPRLVESFVGSTARAGWWIGVLGAAWAAMQFVFSPLLGGLSDRFGRRPIILASNFGLGIDYIVMALAPSLPWLLAGRLISGAASASITTAMAYISDVTAPEKRAQVFGWAGGAIGLGVVAGPALGGALGELDVRAPFWVAGTLSLLSFLYGLLLLPESLAAENRRAFAWKRSNPVGSLGLLTSSQKMRNLAAVYFLAQASQYVLPVALVLYAGIRYDWGPLQIGAIFAAIGVIAAFAQGILTGLLVKAWGEWRTLVFGLLFGAAGLVLFALAPNGWVFWLGVPVISLSGVAGPSIQSLMANSVTASDQGRLHGANMSLAGLAGTVAPLVFGWVFSLFIGELRALGLPGAPLLLSAGVLVIAILLANHARRQASLDS